MKTSTLVGIIIAAIIVIGGVYWYMQRPSSQPGYQSTSGQTSEYGAPNTQPNQPSQTPTQTQPTQTGVSASATVSAPVSVDISNFAFSPATVTVKKGTTITWTNRDTAPHTVTGNNGGPSSQQLSQGMSYSYTFATTGTFSYHCAVHPTMHGTVVVTE